MTQDWFTAPLHLAHLGFTGSTLDRADNLRHDAAALDGLRAAPSARFLAFSDLRARVDLSAGEAHPDLLWLSAQEIPAGAPWVFLGLQGEQACFAVKVGADDVERGDWMEVRPAAAAMPDGRAAMLAQARSLLAWHDRHPHCSVCGALTRVVKGGYQRLCTNEACKAEHFPRTDPVVIMLVTDGDRCLLGRPPRLPAGIYTTLAGFLEPGETIEDAVAREIWEEAGVRVGRVRYIASQPWPFPSTLMIGCFAEAKTHEIRMDATELEDVRWFTRDETRAALAGRGSFSCPPPFAIAHSLITAWTSL
jgi:NAD+ diphosphatase